MNSHVTTFFMSLLSVFLLTMPAHAMHKALITVGESLSQTTHVPIARAHTIQQRRLFGWHLFGQRDGYRAEEMHSIRKETFLACNNIAPLIRRYKATHKIGDLQNIVDAYSTCLKTIQFKFSTTDLLHVVKVSDRERVLEILDKLQREAYTCSELLQSKIKPIPESEPFTPWKNLFALTDIECEPEKKDK